MLSDIKSLVTMCLTVDYRLIVKSNNLNARMQALSMTSFSVKNLLFYLILFRNASGKDLWMGKLQPEIQEARTAVPACKSSPFTGWSKPWPWSSILLQNVWSMDRSLILLFRRVIVFLSLLMVSLSVNGKHVVAIEKWTKVLLIRSRSTFVRTPGKSHL